MITTIDLVILIAAMVVVATVSILASIRERTRDDYFLAGRNLTWWLIGFSLIASNISTEHFVGMTGNAAKSGFAVASYEWLSAPALVIVAWFLLPKFLKAGIFTMPEFLEYRYDRPTRSILAVLMVLFFVLTVLATVLYSGSLFLSGALDIPQFLESRLGFDEERSGALAFQIGVWAIGIGAGIYTVVGGLRAVVWSDLLQGSALIVGGLAVAFLAFNRLGDGAGVFAGWQTFKEAAGDQLKVVRPLDDPNVPSLTLLTGLWIPVMFYWGLNQFITQRTLAAGSLAEGQKGVFFAALIKLMLPLIVVLPGMAAVQILGDSFNPDKTDIAYPQLVRELLPTGLFGLMLAAITGSIMSTFNSGLNSAATVFTLDIYQSYVNPDLSEHGAVRVGRVTTAVLVVAACLWAPVIQSFDGVFAYIQELWGFVSAPTCAIFFVGLVFKRVPAGAAKFALIAGPLFYLISRVPSWVINEESLETSGAIIQKLYAYSSMNFLYHMFILFILLTGAMVLWGALRPLPEPVETPDRAKVSIEHWKFAKPAGIGVIAVTAVLYIVFW